MSQPELLATVADVLDRNRIGYMVTGSIASSLFGQPRSTHDIDLVVSLTAEHARILQDRTALWNSPFRRQWPLQY